MESSEVARAIDAAIAIATELDLLTSDAVVLRNTNKVALRLVPCDVFARVAPVDTHLAPFEVAIAHGLAVTGSPIGDW